jgi:transcriptional regulator with XRE-family HTH domain
VITMKIGDRLHQVRNLHGLTQEQMAAGIISKSQYWRIEKESNAIRASSLIKILNQNKISVLTFFKDADDSGINRRELQYQITNAFFARDYKKLEEIKKQSTNSQMKRLLNWLLAELRGESQTFSDEEKRKLRYNVWQVERWNDDILWFFFHTLYLYKYSNLEGIINALISKFTKNKKIEARQQQLIISIAVRYLNICYEQNNEYEVKKVVCFLHKVPKNAEIGLAKLIADYYEALLNKKSFEAEEI